MGKIVIVESPSDDYMDAVKGRADRTAWRLRVRPDGTLDPSGPPGRTPEERKADQKPEWADR